MKAYKTKLNYQYARLKCPCQIWYNDRNKNLLLIPDVLQVTIELKVASAQAVHTISRKISHENLSLNYEKI